ncbi:MAG: DUF2961 domain-containing protein [Lentisphaeria bacterium]|nr:DUF2961 domain-containing protein [Lentisphaeria bacterium]
MYSLLDALTRPSAGKTFAFSGENPTGAVSGGAPDHPTEKNARKVIAPGETLVLMDCDGPGEITSWWQGGYTGSDCIVRVTYDFQVFPSVEAPLCAFFAYPFDGVTLDHTGKFPVLNSLPVVVTACKGRNCFWKMPFRKHCRITLENRGKTERAAYWMISGEYKVLPEDTLYFHASYRWARPVEEGEVYSVVDGIRGKGHFVGCAAGFETVDSSCWCEGEVKMFIDGENFSSLNFTGTEDYFGGSYSFGMDSPLRQYRDFSTPFAGLFCVSRQQSKRIYAPNRFMAYRWHLPDPVRFGKSFRMTMQNFGIREGKKYARKDNIVSTAYWYQDLPGAKLFPLPPQEILCGNDLP